MQSLGVLILIGLRGGTHRFSELRRKMEGVSEKMLVQSFRALTEDGFVLRVPYPVVPPFLKYSLAPMGEEVVQRAAALADWIEYPFKRMRCRTLSNSFTGGWCDISTILVFQQVLY